MLFYTVLRLLIVAGAAGVLYLFGLRGVLLFVGAVIVGALVSYLALSGPRLRAARAVQAAAQRSPKQSRPDVDALAEDAEVADARGNDAALEPEGSGSRSAEAEQQSKDDAGR